MQSQTQQRLVHAHSANIEQREQDIAEVVSDIVEVNEICKDLAFLVGQQRKQLNTIEANIIATDNHVQSGHREVQEAAKIQKDSCTIS